MFLCLTLDTFFKPSYHQKRWLHKVCIIAYIFIWLLKSTSALLRFEVAFQFSFCLHALRVRQHFSLLENMKVPTVTKFLGVFDLNQGALMLGYLGAISNGTFALLLLIDLVFGGENLKQKIFSITRKAENLSPGVKLIDSDPTLFIQQEMSRNGWLT